MSTYRIVLLIMMFTLGGCGGLESRQSISKPGEKGMIGKLDDIVDDFSCDPSNTGTANQTEKPANACKEAYRNDPKLRLIRARLIAAVAARYATARIDDFSPDKVNDAGRELLQLRRAVTLLDEGYKTLSSGAKADLAMYPTQKADIYESFVELAYASIRPTLKEVSGLIIASPIERLNSGEKILTNLLEDKLYLDAYTDSMTNLRTGYVKTPQDITLKDAWNSINKHMQAACTRLAEQTRSKSDEQCKFIKDIP